MDWSAFTRTLDAYNLHLFAIGTTEITVFTLVKLAGAVGLVRQPEGAAL